MFYNKLEYYKLGIIMNCNQFLKENPDRSFRFLFSRLRTFLSNSMWFCHQSALKKNKTFSRYNIYIYNCSHGKQTCKCM